MFPLREVTWHFLSKQAIILIAVSLVTPKITSEGLSDKQQLAPGASILFYLFTQDQSCLMYSLHYEKSCSSIPRDWPLYQNSCATPFARKASAAH